MSYYNTIPTYNYTAVTIGRPFSGRRVLLRGRRANKKKHTVLNGEEKYNNGKEIKRFTIVITARADDITKSNIKFNNK